MTTSLLDRYRDSWGRIGLCEQSVIERNLPLFEEAEGLEIVAVNPSGQAFQLIPAAATAWKGMQCAAERDGVEMHIVSAYRSVGRQTELIQRKLDAGRTLDDILQVLAPPGCSEHHTGRAIDIGTGEMLPLEPDFELTPAFLWLDANAHRFGFGLSFPRDNGFGYVYEPWHWCYSGEGLG